MEETEFALHQLVFNVAIGKSLTNALEEFKTNWINIQTIYAEEFQNSKLGEIFFSSKFTGTSLNYNFNILLINF